jgi:hypothetical protein
MAYRRKGMAYFLVLLLVFQSMIAAGSTGCSHEPGSEEHTRHDMHNTNMYKYVIHENNQDSQTQSSCKCGCYCAGTCMHACHAPTLITFHVIVTPDVNQVTYLMTESPSFPGYTEHLLRPPAIFI